MTACPAHLIAPGMPGYLGVNSSFSLASFMASQSDGLWYDFTKTASLFQDTAATTPVASIGDPIGRANDLSGKGHNATQSTASLRGLYQTTGDKFDGADDNLLTNYTAGSGANFIVALVTVPAVISATGLLFGASAGTRFYVGFDTSGRVCGGIGNDSISTVVGTSDQRGKEIVCALTCDGSSVRLFSDAAQEYSAAQNGAVQSAIACRLGAQNASGSAGNFFGGSIKKLVAGRQFLDLSTYLKIRSALLAA